MARTHLGWEVVEGAAQSFAAIAGCVAGPAEVGEFDGVEGAEEVLRLDVPVDDVLLVDVGEGLRDLVNDVGALGLIEAAPRRVLELLVELAARDVLQNHVDLVLVEEKAVDGQDVLVLEVEANFNFPLQLLLDPVVDELCLVEDFEGHHEFRVLLARQVNVAELAMAEGLPNFEVLNRPEVDVESAIHISAPVVVRVNFVFAR